MNKNNFCGRVKTTVQDSYNTPKNAWGDILQYINKDQMLWLPFYNDGTAKKILKEIGYNNVIHENKDFFSYFINDCILIDNPPFSIKEKIIKRLYERKFKFCLLLPLDTLERKYILKYKYNLQIIVPNNRYKYTKKGNPPFKSCWFCWNMEHFLKTDKQLIFL